jgi:hypothetical protein
VAQRLREILLGSARLYADGGRHCIERGAGAGPGARADQAGLLLGYGAGRACLGGTDPPDGVYRYAPGRGREHANKTLLGSYRRILKCDGYAAYKRLAAPAADAGPSLLATC